MNPKNTLIEYAFKTGTQSPIFETSRIGGPAHNPIFRCKVCFLGFTFESDGYGKRQAEYNACTLFLDTVTLTKKSASELSEWMITKEELLSIVNRYDTIILLDGDQLETIPEGDANKLNIIVCKHHNISLYNRLKKNKHRLHVYVLECPIVGQDSTDHYITFLLGMIRVLCPNAHTRVISDDHFASIVNMF